MNTTYRTPSARLRSDRTGRRNLSFTNILAVCRVLGFCIGCAIGGAGCAVPSTEAPAASAEQAIIVSVDPSSESASGPNGHTLRLNRDVNGFDALPSPSNDAAGAYFTAPCGCVTLHTDGSTIAAKRYYQHESSVTFDNALMIGTHTYIAMYWPIMDQQTCMGTWTCPSSGMMYTSGAITVNVDDTGRDTYTNRCDKCPAWCDPAHPLHEEKVKSQPWKCERDKRDITLNNVPFQSQLNASCKPNYLCGYAVTNMMTSYLHQIEPKVEYMQKMAEVAKGSQCPTQLSNIDDYTKAAREVGGAPGSDYYYMNFNEIKDVVASGKPLLIGLTYKRLDNHRCIKSWDAGHAVTLVGYDENNGFWRIHDPLCRDAKTGAYRQIPSAQFRAAVADAVGGASKTAVLVVRK